MARRLTLGVAIALVVIGALASPSSARRYSGPTSSSPIAISADGRWVWSVNPGAGTVSVIYTKTNRVVATVRVGDEPQSVALTTTTMTRVMASDGEQR